MTKKLQNALDSVLGKSLVSKARGVHLTKVKLVIITCDLLEKWKKFLSMCAQVSKQLFLCVV
jgi:hypothetical protein